MTPEELEEARLVDEDLAYLMTKWSPTADTRELRHLSPLVRRLLADKHYARAWRSLSLPGEPYITATDLEALLGDVDRSLIQLAFAPANRGVADAMRRGGKIEIKTPAYVHPGSLLAMLVHHEQDDGGPVLAAIPPEYIKSKIAAEPDQMVVDEIRSRIGKRVARGLPLSAYLRSTAALIVGERITRQDVIQYVANKLGGAHYDTSRDKKADARYKLLDKRPATYVPQNGVPAPYVYAELLSIIEALVESGDAARFRDVYAKAAKKHAADTAP
jgi:hypothetical protein